jgi:Phospholipase_D-nuclease N-terminal
MILAEVDYPLLNLFWTTLVIFCWVLWIWLLIRVYSDLFSRRDIGAGAKTLWVVFTILVPFVGTFVYLIAQGRGMAERDQRRAIDQRRAMDDYIRTVAREDAQQAAVRDDTVAPDVQKVNR